MFRFIGKSKIALILAILFGISLFFFRGGSRYSNFFNSDNVVANVSGTSISTTKFNRTLQMNVNQFNQILGKNLTSEEIKAYQIASLALSTLINESLFENEYDKKKFIIDETVIAKKTKERIPQLYINNKLDQQYLNKFLQEQKLQIEDIVQIINYETRDELFRKAFLDINYPKKFSKKINIYDNHKRKIKLIKIPIDLVNVENTIKAMTKKMDEIVSEYYNANIEKYMTEEERNVEYIIVNKNDYYNNFVPTDFDISDYYNNNKDIFLKKETRSFIQFNFRDSVEAQNFRSEVNNFNTINQVIEYADKNEIKFNSFDKMNSEEMLEKISKILFQLNINEKSDVIETPLAKHIIILKDIQPSYQLKLDEAKNQIIDIITSVELNNYFSDLYDDINREIANGESLLNISQNLKLKINKIENLNQSFNNYENKDKVFFDSLIQNSFSSNKDFVSNIIRINSEKFYFFDVKDIKVPIKIDLNEIKDVVYNDWTKELKIEELRNLTTENLNNSVFVENLSEVYKIPIDNLELSNNSRELPSELIIKTFNNKKSVNVFTFSDNNAYVANIEDIILSNLTNNEEEISLMDDLRGSFANELMKKVQVSTNDNLINAILDKY